MAGHSTKDRMGVFSPPARPRAMWVLLYPTAATPGDWIFRQGWGLSDWSSSALSRSLLLAASGAVHTGTTTLSPLSLCCPHSCLLMPVSSSCMTHLRAHLLQESVIPQILVTGPASLNFTGPSVYPVVVLEPAPPGYCGPAVAR